MDTDASRIDHNLGSVSVSLTLTNDTTTEIIKLTNISDYITKTDMVEKLDLVNTFAKDSVVATLVFVSDRLTDESALSSHLVLSDVEVELNNPKNFKVAFNNMLEQKKFYDFTNLAKFKLEQTENYVINSKNMQENKTFFNAGYIYLKPKSEKNSIKYRVYIYDESYYEKDGLDRPKFKKF